MKVIDLLNKIAKDELEDLALVKFCEHDCLTIYHKADNRFEFANKGDWEDYFYKIDIEELNDEVEIIEEEQDIEELNITERRKREDCYPLTVEIMAKINELIKVVNEMKKNER